MDAPLLLQLLERTRRSRPAPLSEAWASAAGGLLLDWLAREHALTPPRLHREEFARLGCMSPEQARGRPLDIRSDLFCVALVLFELCCGRLPYEGIPELVAGELAAPRELNPKLHEAFAAVLSRALSLDPGQRFATAAELKAALVQAAPPVGPEALDAWSASLAPPAEPAAPPPPAPPAAARRPWAGIALLIAVPVLATLVTLRISEHRQVEVERAYAQSLRACEVLSEPAGASIGLDGVVTGQRTPAVLNLEPDRDYLIDLRSPSGGAARKVRNQKRLAVRLLDGAVLENGLYGTPPPAPRGREASLRPVKEQPVEPAPAPAHVAYDLESAPATFTLSVEHQVLIPEKNCVRLSRKLAPVSALSWMIPLLALNDHKPRRLAVVDDWSDLERGTDVCLFMLTDRPNDHGPKLDKIAQPMIYVPAEHRLLIRALDRGSWRVSVTGLRLGGPAPVMTEGTPTFQDRRVTVLDQPTPVTLRDPRSLWFTVPVLAPDPAATFSVTVEKDR